MWNKFLCVLLALTGVSVAYGQGWTHSWEEICAQRDVYLVGEGVGTSIDEADRIALADLISQISVVVSKDFSLTKDETSVNGEFDTKSYANLKMQTYSNATLTNTERIVVYDHIDEIKVGRYILKSEIDRIFEGRIRTLKEYIRLGRMAEGKLKIDDALRNYYWAYSMIKSVPHPSEIEYFDEVDYVNIHPATWLPQQIDNILDGLDIEVLSHDDTYVDLDFTYLGEPVSSLDFTYFDGRNWSNICSVKDGFGTMEFYPGMIPENIQINYEYAYRSQAHMNVEVKSILDVVKGQALRKARTTISLNKREPARTVAQGTATAQKSAKTAATASSHTAQDYFYAEEWGDQLSTSFEKPYRDILQRISDAITNNDYTTLSDCFTENGMDMFTKLVMYGKARLINDDSCTVYKYRDYVVARSIQMSFSFKNGIRENFIEDIVFTFNKDKKIDCVAFGLDKIATDDIMTKNVWPLLARQTLIEFLENYKTAYALKRLDYLRQIFDDNAVIIVGHIATKMEKVTDGDHESYQAVKHITRTQLSKEQYMSNLERCFASNEYVNIRFANNDILRAMGKEEYGIQIKQDYYSTNYGDQGYLYLQVNIDNPDEPIIKVRTWQPEPDPEIGLYGIGHF